MKYLRNYQSNYEASSDYIIPITYIMNSSTTQAYYIDKYTLYTSGTDTVTSKTSNNNGIYNYNVMIVLQIPTNLNEKAIGIKINNNDIIWGKFYYSHATMGDNETMDASFSGDNLIIRYYFRTDSKGRIYTSTYLFQTSLDLELNSTITYEIYTR